MGYIFVSFFIHFFIIFLKNDEFDSYKKIIYGFFIIVPVLISFVFFRYNLIDKTNYNIEDFNIYLELWDHHRNITNINFDYIIKTLFF